MDLAISVAAHRTKWWSSSRRRIWTKNFKGSKFSSDDKLNDILLRLCTSECSKFQDVFVNIGIFCISIELSWWIFDIFFQKSFQWTNLILECRFIWNFIRKEEQAYQQTPIVCTLHMCSKDCSSRIEFHLLWNCSHPIKHGNEQAYLSPATKKENNDSSIPKVLKAHVS